MTEQAASCAPDQRHARTGFALSARVVAIRQHEPQGLIEPARQQHRTNAASRREEPEE
jgi:hypothetical protein